MRKVSECFDELKVGMWVRLKTTSREITGVIGEKNTSPREFYILQDTYDGARCNLHPANLGYKYSWRVTTGSWNSIEILSHSFKPGDIVKVVRVKALFPGEEECAFPKELLGKEGVVEGTINEDSCGFIEDDGTSIWYAQLWMPAKMESGEEVSGRSKHQRGKGGNVEFKVGETVVKARAYSGSMYCSHGGREEAVPLGTKGKVTSAYNGKFVSVLFANGVGWMLDPSELDHAVKCKPEVKNGEIAMETIVKSMVNKKFKKYSLEDATLISKEMTDRDLGSGFMAERALDSKEAKEAVLAEAKRRKKVREDEVKK